jgi:hypothetical protein
LSAREPCAPFRVGRQIRIRPDDVTHYEEAQCQQPNGDSSSTGEHTPASGRVNGKTERFSLRTADLQEAKRRLKDHLAKPAGETVGELVDDYLDDKDKTAIRAVDLRGAWKQAKATFGHLGPIRSPATYAAYRDQRYAAGRKPNTVRKELEVVAPR